MCPLQLTDLYLMSKSFYLIRCLNWNEKDKGEVKLQNINIRGTLNSPPLSNATDPRSRVSRLHCRCVSWRELFRQRALLEEMPMSRPGQAGREQWEWRRENIPFAVSKKRARHLRHWRDKSCGIAVHYKVLWCTTVRAARGSQAQALGVQQPELRLI